MAAYAAVASLMNTIEQITNNPRLSALLDNNLIQSIHEKAGFLLGIIEGNDYGGPSKTEFPEEWIASAVHAAEDAIESRIVDQIHAESSFLIKIQKTLTYMMKKVKHLKRIRSAPHAAEDVIECDQKSLESSLYLQKIIQFMDDILTGASMLKEEQTSHSRPDLLEIGESAMVGFEEELNQIMAELTNERTSRHTISIVGMGGTGKSTLARNVYQNSLLKDHFDIIAWATVSQQSDINLILSELLSGYGKSSGGSADELGLKLHKKLFNVRYLIILDDIWSVEVLHALKHFFPDNGNGSRILITTRLSNVANDSESSQFTMNLLDEDKSWELLCRKAFQRENCPYPELEEVGKEIARLCKGLPLSIVVIGGSLLKSPRTLRHWGNTALDIKSVLSSRGKRESIDVLISSYNHLPPHLKPCFIHLGVFLGPFSEFQVSEIVELWSSEGFLRSNNGRVLEEIAEDYLKDLTDRNLIKVSRWRHDNGRMKYCEMHDLLRSLCIELAFQQGIEHFHMARNPLRATSCRRRIMYRAPLKICTSKVERWELNKHKLLRRLDAPYGMSLSVEEAFRCVNLRYLRLRKPNDKSKGVWKLPPSVSLLWNLRTLILGESWMFKKVVAPTEIWKMRQLRHIKCPRIYLPHPSRHGSSAMENLQTLKTLVNFRLSEEMCRIIPNIKNLHLVYGQHLQGYDDGLIECLCNLHLLSKLESLYLIVGCNLSVLNSNLNSILTFLSSLNKLSLGNCQLHWDDLTKIGCLPLLKVLNLEAFSVTEGEEWSPVDGQFLRLKFLRIKFCKLTCWNAESYHFPVLEKLVLVYLSKLEGIPWGICEIPTLKLIHVDDCSESAADSAVEMRDQLKYEGYDDLQIRVTDSNTNQESFIETLKTKSTLTFLEGLWQFYKRR